MMNTSSDAISEQDVQELATTRSFERGLSYFVRGAIENPMREGDVLQAECEGSAAINCRLRVEIGKTGIGDTWCSCPYDYGGMCKHLVALLLTWVREPERFVMHDALSEILETLPRESLITLIGEMVRREPSLDELIAPYRTQTSESSPPAAPQLHRVRAATYAREIATIIGEGADWYHMDELVDGLYTVQRTAEGFAQRGELTNAAVVYTELLRGCVENIQYCDDSGGSLGSLGQECAAALQETLPKTDWDETERQLWLLDMFELCVNDMGGYGFEDNLTDMIVAAYQPADTQVLESWIREAMDEHKDKWKQRGLVTMLLKMYEREGRDEAYLKLCAEHGRRLAQCQKLLTLGREEEAMGLVQQRPLPGHEAWPFIEQLEQAGHETLAREVAEAVLPEARGWPLDKISNWLLSRYQQEGEEVKAMNIHLARFRARPSFAAYQAIVSLAQESGDWEQIASEVKSQVQRGPASLQVQVALANDDLQEAIAIVARSERMLNESLVKQVVNRAGQSAEHYRWAITIYERLAEKQIASKSRRFYQEARGYLSLIRDIYRRHKAQDEWDACIAGVRRRHRGKRLFLEIIEGLS